jgi:hypothetical protein
MAVLPTDYTDATTPTGATTEYPATTERGLNATHTQINANTSDIATKADSSSGALTGPKINQIKDTNGNLMIDLAANANAVNYFEFDNGATNFGPIIYAWGTDPTVDLRLATKSGQVTIDNVPAVTTTGTQDLTGKRATLAAGSTTVAPLKFTSGTNLTTPAAGAQEFDGSTFAGTIDTTSLAAP